MFKVSFNERIITRRMLFASCEVFLFLISIRFVASAMSMLCHPYQWTSYFPLYLILDCAGVGHLKTQLHPLST